MSEFADYCDACGEGVKYGGRADEITAYLLPTGEIWDGAPVVRVLCPPCHEKAVA